MATNEGWPEAFGFSIDGDRPVYITAVDEGGSAQQAGLLPGDVIVEMDGEGVREYSRDDLIVLARHSKKVPPSLIVLSRVRTVTLRRGGRVSSFGLTLRGDAPVFIRSVEFNSRAREAGLRSGDLILEVDGCNVRYASRYEVLELLNQSGDETTMVVVAGGLELRTRFPGGGGGGGMQDTMETRYRKAKDFHRQLHYYLIGDQARMTNLITLLRLYAKDHNIHNFGKSVSLLLDTPTARKLIPSISTLVHPKHRSQFEDMVSYNSQTHSYSGSSPRLQHHRRGLNRSYSDSSLPASVFNEGVAKGVRLVAIEKSQREGFGFTISGNAPVFIRSVDVGGVADKAGLKSNDYILEINGLSVRTSTHSEVVRLLKGSGSSPVLLISSEPYPSQQHGIQRHNHRAGTLPEGSPRMSSKEEHKRQSLLLKRQMHQFLDPAEEEQVVQQLEEYSRNGNVQSLVNQLVPILSDSSKAVLFHQICQLLPRHSQDEFDHQAANLLAEGLQLEEFPPASRCSLASTESVPDILARVQQDQLPQEVTYSSHPVPSNLFRRKQSAPAVVTTAMSRLFSSGQRFGSDLDLVPVRDEEESAPIQIPRQAGHYFDYNSEDGFSTGSSIPSIEEEEEEEEPTISSGSGSLELPDHVKPVSVSSNGETREPANPMMAATPQTLVQGRSGRDIVKGLQNRKRKKQVATSLPGLAQVSNKSPDASNVSVASSIPPPPPPMSTPQGGPGAHPPPPPPPPPPSVGRQNDKGLQLKRVNWEKLSASNVQGTVWSQMRGSPLQDALEYVDLEENFAIQQSKKPTRQGSKKPAVLDQKKAYNLSILLGHMKLSIGQIRSAVLACDEAVLSEQHLRQMETFAPSNPECAAYTKYVSNPSVLSIPDQFSCEMSTIPSYRERLRAMLFKIHFQDSIAEIKPDLEAIIRASRQLQDSKVFSSVLELILAMGNHLNVGNQRIAQAAGFKISFLTKLRSTKTTDNKSTLLHYLVRTIQKKFPELSHFPEYLSAVAPAARVSGQTLETEIDELRQGIQDIKRELRVISSGDPVEGDCFVDVMSSFLSTAEKEYQAVLQLHRSAMTEFRLVAKFFGEDPQTMRLDDFFAAFADFIKNFQAAVAEVAAEEKKKDEKDNQTAIAELIKERKKNNAGQPQPERV